MHIAADILTARCTFVHECPSVCHSARAAVRVTSMFHVFVWEGSILFV